MAEIQIIRGTIGIGTPLAERPPRITNYTDLVISNSTCALRATEDRLAVADRIDQAGKIQRQTINRTPALAGLFLVSSGINCPAK
jgi:hypothetical protein